MEYSRLYQCMERCAQSPLCIGEKKRGVIREVFEDPEVRLERRGRQDERPLGRPSNIIDRIMNHRINPNRASSMRWSFLELGKIRYA